jgi:hypothetical protein
VAPMSRWRLLLAKCLDWGSVALLTILSTIRVAHPTAPENPEGILDYLHVSLVRHYVAIILSLAILALVGKVAQEVLSSVSKVRVKAVLNALHDGLFVGIPEQERYHNRVTLFRANRKRDQLKPYCRSGTQYQRSQTFFYVSEDDERQNEGVAGLAWFRNATIFIDDVPESCSTWDDCERCRAYAEATYVPPELAAKMKVRARCFLALPVRSFDGAIWGVLVIDSRKPGGIDRSRDGVVELLNSALGKML